MSGAGTIRYGREDPNYDENCPLCRMEKKTEWFYEDYMMVICRCETHPDKWMVVLKRHIPIGEMSPEEMRRTTTALINMHPDGTLVQMRRGEKYREHAHLHEA